MSTHTTFEPICFDASYIYVDDISSQLLAFFSNKTIVFTIRNNFVNVVVEFKFQTKICHHNLLVWYILYCTYLWRSNYEVLILFLFCAENFTYIYEISFNIYEILFVILEEQAILFGFRFLYYYLYYWEQFATNLKVDSS